MAGAPEDLLSTPRVVPRVLPSPTWGQLARRTAATATALARHLGPVAVRARNGPARRAALPSALRGAFEELGATFVKLGQLVASSPGVFGEEVAEEFRTCLDTGPAVPLDQVRDTVEADLGLRLSDAFAEVDPWPVGQASIAVVHRARLADGRPVALKVLRPGIDATVATDLALIRPLLELAVHQTGDQTLTQLAQQLDGFRQQLGEELDLRNEGRAMAHYRALLGRIDLPLVTVPAPFPELSGPRVLTMEYLDGVPVDDLAQVADLGYDPRPLVEQVLRAWFVTAIRWGMFHGDVHAGNLRLLRDGRIAVLDWGIVGRLDPETHGYFRRILEAALGDESAWDDVARHVAAQYGSAVDQVGLDHEGLRALVRATVEPLLTRPFGEVSLSTLLRAPQDQIDRSLGGAARSRSLRARLRRVRAQRRVRALTEAEGLHGSDWDRGTFLLAKQLLYFERYGRLFLPDVPLLGDRSFLRAVLAEDPAG
jgi:predicted unusual protein kinase regulating ubiquinone biosynthesis (AarF/ABC1/UbiB family)